MPEPTKVVSPTFVFSKDLLQKKLDRVIEFQNTFTGKVNHNPFLWIRKNVTPLYNRLAGISSDGVAITPETTKELHDAIMKLSETEAPIINKGMRQADSIIPTILKK